MSNPSSTHPEPQSAPSPAPWRRRPVQRRSAERVDRIVDAARAILGESGYQATTTKAIASRADVAVGSLYQFFSGKEEIVASVAARFIDEMVDLVTELASTDYPDLHSAVEVLVRAYADFYRREPAFRALWVDHHLDATLSEADRRLNTAIAVEVKQLLDPLLDDDLPLVDYEIVTEIGDALLDLAFARDPDGDPRIIDSCSVAICAYLLAVVTG